MKMRYIIGILLVIIGLGSCSNVEKESVEPSNRTVLVYMIASNLGDNLSQNIEDMITAATKKNLNGGNLVVFYSSNKNEAELFQIKEGNGGIVTRHHIRDYVGQSAISPEVMKGVIQEVISLFPSDSYGLIMSSHGTAWMPYNFDKLRSFGEESGKWMEINELSQAIPSHVFDFLMFDACYMASTECVYQLKDKADYILASPTETLVEGFPYKLVLPYFFTKDLQLNKVAETFYNYYNAKKGDFQTATVSVTKTDELNELATIVKEILADKSENDIYALPLSEMQVLEHLTYNAPYMLYDLKDFIGKLATDEQYTHFETCLNKVIVCKYSTENAFFGKPNRSFPIKRFSGLSVYTPQETFPQLNEWYKQLDWYNAVYK